MLFSHKISVELDFPCCLHTQHLSPPLFLSGGPLGALSRLYLDSGNKSILDAVRYPGLLWTLNTRKEMTVGVRELGGR